MTGLRSRRWRFGAAGAGIAANAKPDAIRAAVERLIGEPSFRTAAERVGATITADARAQRGLAELEALASG
jgi:UDP:flavonoid glycosyltransferase YjiC (YdhE family)